MKNFLLLLGLCLAFLCIPSTAQIKRTASKPKAAQISQTKPTPTPEITTAIAQPATNPSPIIVNVPEKSDLLGFATLMVTLITLVASSVLAYKSFKAAERAAESSEESAKSATISSKTATDSLEEQKTFNTKTLEAQSTLRLDQQNQNAVSAEHAERSLAMQREHNYKSVTPILRVQTLDHDEEVSVKLFNDGIGPLIITDVTVTNGHDFQKDLISWMPSHPRRITYWTTFISGFGETSIYPGQFRSWLLLENTDPDFPDFVVFRRFVRRSLSKLTLTVSYRDIYDRHIGTKTTNLVFFGRTVPRQERDGFSITLATAKQPICSVEEWDEMVNDLQELSPINTNDRVRKQD